MTDVWALTISHNREEAAAQGRKPWEVLPQGLLAPCRYLPGMGRTCRQEPRPDLASKSGPCPRSSEVPNQLGVGSLAFRCGASGDPGQAVAATACVGMPSSVAW